MNYIKHLTGFFAKIAQDPDITSYCISLYISIFQRWNINRFRNPIYVIRYDLMNEAKISSTATYHRCLKILIDHEYLSYKASYSAGIPSSIQVFDLSQFVVSESLETLKRPQRDSDERFKKNKSPSGTNDEEDEEEAKHPPNNQMHKQPGQHAHKHASEQVPKQPSQHTHKHASEQVNEHVYEQVNKQANEHLLKTKVQTDYKQKKTRIWGERSPQIRKMILWFCMTRRYLQN